MHDKYMVETWALKMISCRRHADRMHKYVSIQCMYCKRRNAHFCLPSASLRQEIIFNAQLHAVCVSAAEDHFQCPSLIKVAPADQSSTPKTNCQGHSQYLLDQSSTPKDIVRCTDNIFRIKVAPQKTLSGTLTVSSA